MKTLCRLASFVEEPNVSLYLLPDEMPVTIADNLTTVGDLDDPSFVILDCNTANVVLYENVPEPLDYCGWKYTYIPDQGRQETSSWQGSYAQIQQDEERARQEEQEAERARIEAEFAAAEAAAKEAEAKKEEDQEEGEE